MHTIIIAMNAEMPTFKIVKLGQATPINKSWYQLTHRVPRKLSVMINRGRGGGLFCSVGTSH